MNKAIALFKNGDSVSGEYDGYGGLGWTELDWCTEFALVHQACHKAMGKPGFDEIGPSGNASDQGYFYNESDYTWPEPQTKNDVLTMAKKAPY
jgi:hypothetical protein